MSTGQRLKLLIDIFHVMINRVGGSFGCPALVLLRHIYALDGHPSAHLWVGIGWPYTVQWHRMGAR